MPPGEHARGRDVTVYDRARIPAHPHGHCRGCGHPLLPRTRCYGAIPCTLHITGSAVERCFRRFARWAMKRAAFERGAVLGGARRLMMVV